MRFGMGSNDDVIVTHYTVVHCTLYANLVKLINNSDIQSGKEKERRKRKRESARKGINDDVIMTVVIQLYIVHCTQTE